jgi:16S rRNA (guanine(1405)-N(7))-methyltransferase
MTPNNDELDALVDKIKASRKYSNTCEDTIRDVAKKALSSHKRRKDALKAAKTMLHRIQTSYLRNIHFEDELENLANLYSNGDMDGVKSVCLKLMQEHASTRERIPILDDFYREIFAVTGVPKRILDVASGIHPLSIPWMGLPGDIVYRAYEIDQELVKRLNRFFEIIGFEPLARLQDVICTPPVEAGDLAFAMKIVPCMECREKRASIRLLKELSVQYLVVTFPVKSLSGRSRNMTSFYSNLFDDMVSEHEWKVVKISIQKELVFVVDKRR